MGLFGHAIALEVQAACTGGKERSRGGGWGEVRAGKIKEEKVSEKVLKFCACKDYLASWVLTGEEASVQRGHMLTVSSSKTGSRS